MATYLPKPRIPIINWENPITRGLIFDCPLFEGSGTAPKEIVQNLPGTFDSTPSWKRNIYGNSMNFSATKGVHWTHNAGMVTARARTMEAWFISTGSQSGATNDIFYKNNSGIIRYSSSGFRWISWPGPVVLNYNGEALTTGKLYHLVGVNKKGLQQMWLNGVLVASSTNASAYSDGTSNVYIGCSDSVTEPWTGDILSVRKWNRDLSIKEILTLYSNPWVIYKKRKIK